MAKRAYCIIMQRQASIFKVKYKKKRAARTSLHSHTSGSMVRQVNNEAPFLPDLIRMFQNANMKIVVEGVETKEMKDMLMQMECDYLQGFYFAKGLPEDEFIKFMEENKNRRW